MLLKKIMIIELGIIMFILIGSPGYIKSSAFAAEDERKTPQDWSLPKEFLKTMMSC